MRTYLFAVLAGLLFLTPAGYASNIPDTDVSSFNFMQDIDPQIDGSLVSMVVEIPAGTTEKWEVSPETGLMAQEIKDMQPRIIKYLGYPGNYGMIPRTLLPTESGGDGDPLDILSIGAPLKRGQTARVKIIGILKFLDHGEQDDKLLAVLPDTALGNLRSLAELNEQFPGIVEIIRIWFENYKGPGEMVFQGYGSVQDARSILTDAYQNYSAR
ncbi:MAG: inorganic diphosphatase [Candidatus Omnitrophota bacterium]